MQRFNKLIGGLLDNAAEREYRLKVASLPKLENTITVDKPFKENTEGLPSFCFQQETYNTKPFSPNAIFAQSSVTFSQNIQNPFRSGFHKPSAFKDNQNISLSTSPIKITNRQVLNSRLQAECRSRSHSISSRHSSSPKEDSPALLNKKTLNSRTNSFKNASKKPIIPKEESTFLQKASLCSNKESEEQIKPIVFKSKGNQSFSKHSIESKQRKVLTASFTKKSISSQSSLIHSIKPQKCVKDMTLNELQILFPDFSELAKIISDSKQCDSSCLETGKCPAELYRRIEEAKTKNIKSVTELINEI